MFLDYIKLLSSIVQNIDSKYKYYIESKREELNKALLESLIIIRNHLK